MEIINIFKKKKYFDKGFSHQSRLTISNPTLNKTTIPTLTQTLSNSTLTQTTNPTLTQSMVRAPIFKEGWWMTAIGQKKICELAIKLNIDTTIVT